jgi:SOS response associated peptidase (SRAP)
VAACRENQRAVYCFEVNDGELFAFAELWERWKDPSGDRMRPCAILTTTTNAVTGAVHDRMPEILVDLANSDDYDLWLDSGFTDVTRELATQFNVHVGTTPNIKLISCLLGLTVLSAMISSVWPSFVAVKTSIDPILRQGGLQGGGRIHHRARGLLVVSQVAMSLTLLIACGLLLRTIFALKHVSLGFRTDHVIVADLVIPA